MTRNLVYLTIVLVASLVGLSLSKITSSDPWVPTIGATLIALVAIGVSSLVSPNVKSFEKKESPKNLLGLKVATVGFGIAISGWLLAVFISHIAGYVFALIGILTGFVGMAIHFFRMIYPDGNA